MIDLELLRKAVDESNDGIVIAEPEGDEHVLIYVNRAFERLTGYTADEILYRDCRFLQCDDRDQPGLDRVRAALRASEPCYARLRNYRKDGTLFWNELSIAPVFNDKDQLTYYIGVQKDVTELVALEERFRETERAMNRALQRLAELEATLQRGED